VLGRDSESLNDRMFIRILKDAHDNGVIDLRRRGDDFEVAPAAEADSVADQLAKAAAATAPVTAPSAPAPRVGMGPRGASRGRGRLVELPANLLSIGVVQGTPVETAPAEEAAEEPKAARPKKGGGRKRAPKAESAEGEAKTPRARSARTPRAKKATARTGS
jgi:hypothetical protein